MFDVIVGNPPYQSNGASKGNKLWPKFITQSVSLLSSSGVLAMVTPTAWATGGSNIPGGVGIIKDVFKKHQVLRVDVNNITSRFFPTISIDIGYFILKNTEIAHPTPVIMTDGVACIDFIVTDFICPIFTKLDTSIFQKFFDNNGRGKFEVVSFDRSISKGTVSESPKKTKTHKFKHWVLGGSKAENGVFIWLGQNNSSNLNYPKVLFTISNRYWQPYYDLEGISVAAQGFAIKLSGKEKEEHLSSVFDSKIFTFISMQYQLNLKGFMKTNLAKVYPKVDLTRTWTDQELYQHFNLTQEEIDYIEKTIKN